MLVSCDRHPLRSQLIGPEVCVHLTQENQSEAELGWDCLSQELDVVLGIGGPCGGPHDGSQVSEAGDATLQSKDEASC